MGYIYIYSDSETCVVVSFNPDSHSRLSDGSSTLLFRSWTILLADFKGKIKSGSHEFNWGKTVTPLAFEIQVQLKPQLHIPDFGPRQS